MRVIDYLRLSFAGVKAHKKRAFTVVIVVGLLFSVVTAGVFALQGLENATLAEMLAPTDGKVLVVSSVDTKVCGENCDIVAEVAEIKQNVERYDGEIIKTAVSQTTDGIFYRLKENLFMSAQSKNDSEVTEVIVPLEVAAKLADIEMPESDAEVADKLATIQEVRAKTLHRTVESKTGEKYYIAEILPGGVYVSSLSLASIGQGGNPLDLILGQISTGTSQNFIIKSAEAKPEVNNGNDEQCSGFVTMGDMDAEEMGIVFAQFKNIEEAYKYYQDKVNYCSEIDRIFSMCGKDYKYQVMTAVSNPLTTYENLQNIWLVFKVVAAVLVVIAAIIALSTYARLIGKDLKIISLYHALGATTGQIRVVYVVYLLILSVMAVGFAVIVGLILAAVLSIANITALEQVRSLAFGVEAGAIWLIGWNNLIWWPTGVMLLTAVVAVILGNGNFTSKELAKKMK